MKPQFEAGRARVGKGGIVRDLDVRVDVVGEVVAGLAACGLGVRGLIASPITGADGNVEFLAYARRTASVDGQCGSDAIDRCRRDRGRRPRGRVNALRRVGLVPHRDRPLAHTLALAAVEWFRDRDVEVRLPKAEAEAASLAHLGVDPDAFIADLDLVISIGGDGTMLHTVQLVYPAPVPILGVNAGQLGYLTALEPEELQPALPRLLAGDFTVSPTHDARGRVHHERGGAQ